MSNNFAEILMSSEPIVRTLVQQIVREKGIDRQMLVIVEPRCSDGPEFLEDLEDLGITLGSYYGGELITGVIDRSELAQLYEDGGAQCERIIEMLPPGIVCLAIVEAGSRFLSVSPATYAAGLA